MDDFDEVLGMDPPALRAEALYSRGVSYRYRCQPGDWAKALDDLAAVIDMEEAPLELREKARLYRDEMNKQRE
jgi:hypothetical protein